MSVPIRVDEELYESAKKTAAAEFRTAPLQIAYWAKVGKLALENPDLPVEFLLDLLVAKEQTTEPFEFIE